MNTSEGGSRWLRWLAHIIKLLTGLYFVGTERGSPFLNEYCYIIHLYSKLVQNIYNHYNKYLEGKPENEGKHDNQRWLEKWLGSSKIRR